MVEQLTEGAGSYRPYDVTPDGNRLVVDKRLAGGGNNDLYVLSLAGEPTEEPLFQTEFQRTSCGPLARRSLARLRQMLRVGMRSTYDHFLTWRTADIRSRPVRLVSPCGAPMVGSCST